MQIVFPPHADRFRMDAGIKRNVLISREAWVDELFNSDKISEGVAGTNLAVHDSDNFFRCCKSDGLCSQKLLHLFGIKSSIAGDDEEVKFFIDLHEERLSPFLHRESANR